MNIFLTGHRGFIGSHMLEALIRQGHQVTTYEWEDGVRPGVLGQDWVIHMGAISSTVERNIDKVLRQNYEFSRELFDECKTYGVNLQYSSSASIYGIKSTFREDADPDPRTPYAWSKYLFERYHQQHQGGNQVQGFRYFNVYGPQGESHKGSQASPHYQFMKQYQETGQVRVFENSENYLRDFIHVSRVIDTHLKFFDVGESGVWNVGTGTATSFRSVAELYTKNIVEIPMPDVLKDSYQEYTCADITKLEQTLSRSTG